MSSTQLKIERRNQERVEKFWKKRNFKLEKTIERVYFMRQSGFRKVLRWIPFHRTASPEDRVMKRRERRSMLLSTIRVARRFQKNRRDWGKGKLWRALQFYEKRVKRTWKSERRLSADVSSAKSSRETEWSVSSARAIRATSSARVDFLW